MLRRASAIAAVIIVAATCTRARTADLNEFFSALPKAPDAFVTCPDAPRLRAELAKCSMEDILTVLTREDLAKGAGVTQVYQGLSGRALVCILDLDKIGSGMSGLVVMAETDPKSPLAMMVNMMQTKGLGRPPPDGISDFGPQGSLFFDGKLLILGESKTVREIATRVKTPATPTPSPLNEPVFSRIKSAKDGILVYVRDVQQWRRRFEAPFLAQFPANARITPAPAVSQKPFNASFIRLLTGLLQADRYGALAATVNLTDAGLLLECVTEAKGAKPADAAVPEIMGVLRIISWMAAGQCENFASVSKRLREGMRAADSDIADEYDAELAEVNKDLGFDFEKDFLANIGRQWSLRVFPQGSWIVSFAVRDMNNFVQHAARMAAFSKQPWTAVEKYHQPVFKTSAYTMPLLVHLRGSMCIITNSEELLGLDASGPPISRPVPPSLPDPIGMQPAEGETLASAFIWNVKADPEALAALEIPAEIAKPLREDAALWFRQDTGAGYIRLRLGTWGVSEADIRKFVQALLNPPQRQPEEPFQ